MTIATSDTPGITPYPLVERGNIIIKGRDSDALEIGESIRRAKASVAESLRHLIDAGRALIRKKESMYHGEWLPWLKANADVLGFDSRQTAHKLMQAARKCRVDATFDDPALEPGPSAPEPVSTAEKVAALTSMVCHWPCGDPRHSDFRFCGEATTIPPYCEQHRRAAYMAPPPRRLVCRKRRRLYASARIAWAG